MCLKAILDRCRVRDSAGTNRAGEGMTSKEPGEVRVSVGKLADRILSSTVDEQIAPARESVALLLHHHIGAITDGSVQYDPERGEIRSEGSEMRLRIDRFPVPGLTWQAYYGLVTAVGVTTIVGSLLELSTFGRFSLESLSIGFLSLLLASTLYQFWTRVDVSLNPLSGTE